MHQCPTYAWHRLRRRRDGVESDCCPWAAQARGGRWADLSRHHPISIAPEWARRWATACRRGGHPISIARNGARRGRIRALRTTTNSARRLGVGGHDHQFGASFGRRRARPPIRRVGGRRPSRVSNRRHNPRRQFEQIPKLARGLRRYVLQRQCPFRLLATHRRHHDAIDPAWRHQVEV